MRTILPAIILVFSMTFAHAGNPPIIGISCSWHNGLISVPEAYVKAIVNSGHHQAIKDVAKGFTVTAWAKDGIIEAIENQSLKIIAVQFHPEEMASSSDTVMQKLFSSFIRQA